MITNDRQYKISRARAEEFAELLGSQTERPRSDDEWSDLEVQAVKSQLDELYEEIEEYEKLKEGRITDLQIDSLEELPIVLVKARIASGLTQRELAEKLGLKEQQIQRYEQNEYAGVSIDRIREVIAALNLSVKQNIGLPGNHRSMNELVSRLNAIGIDRSLLQNRFLPSTAELMNTDNKLHALVERVSRVYGWQPAAVLAGNQLQLPTSAIDDARFKLPSKVDERRLSGYCIYAHYIALLALQTTPHVRPKPLPADWNTLREQLLTEFGRTDLDAVLSYLWDLGVVVVPLFDSGLFHGACWRISGRNVIVLKQRTKAVARWLVDVLHEYYHLSTKPGDDIAILEPAEGRSAEREYEDEEIDATDFAGDVLLEGRADELAVLCQKESKGHVEQLKNVVARVARNEHLDVGVLANYMAYRLGQNKINWWGAAMNLQPDGPDPSDVVRSKLLANANLKLLNEVDRDLFITALRPLEVLDGAHS
jgi:transcriptional regulator with XRE-family HTH domain